MVTQNLRADLLCGSALNQPAGGTAINTGCITDITRIGLGNYQVVTEPGVSIFEHLALTQPFGNLLTHVEVRFIISSLQLFTYDISGAGAPVLADRQFYIMIFKVQSEAF